MSYVIQNFYKLETFVAPIPRVKLINAYTTLYKRFFFFKINLFFLQRRDMQITIFPLNSLLVLYQTFFLNDVFLVSRKFALVKSLEYTNNWQRSLILFSLRIFNNFLINRRFQPSSLQIARLLVYNAYYIAFKTHRTALKKKFYTQAFFYYILVTPFQ